MGELRIHLVKENQVKLFFMVIAIFVFSLASTCFAQPTITGFSGSAVKDSIVQISGTGFGTKSPAAPVLYANFSSDINPSSLGRLRSWAETACFVWDSTNGVGGGGVAKTDSSCAVSAYGAMYVDLSSIGFYPNALSQNFYIFRNRKKAYTGDVNLKSMEFNKKGSYGTADLIYNHSSNQWITQGLTPSSYFYVSDTPNNQWTMEELVAQTGTSNGSQALKFDWYVNGSLAGSLSNGDICLRDDSNNMDFVAVAYHGDYNASSGKMGLEYFDNLYLDNTWSRVILGDAATLASCTHREIQVPTAWSANAVSISFNPGSFQQGQTAYLYVIDSSNVFNSKGFAVTIGTGSTGSVPGAPTGLTTQ
jgi:hypothetical protein